MRGASRPAGRSHWRNFAARPPSYGVLVVHEDTGRWPHDCNWGGRCRACAPDLVSPWSDNRVTLDTDAVPLGLVVR